MAAEKLSVAKASRHIADYIVLCTQNGTWPQPDPRAEGGRPPSRPSHLHMPAVTASGRRAPDQPNKVGQIVPRLYYALHLAHVVVYHGTACYVLCK